MNASILNNNINIYSKINHFQFVEIDVNKEFIRNAKEEICLICLENYSISDKICYLPCFHFFHSSCIKEWIKNKSVCPLCNNNL